MGRLSQATGARSSPLPGWLLAASLVALWGVLRLVVFKDQAIPLTYVLPLLVCVWTGSRRMLVAMAVIFAVMAFVEMLVLMPATSHQLVGFVATMVNIVVGALVVHAIMRLRERLESSLADVTAANVRVQAQSQELAAQNEELIAQADQLDALNSELGQRAKVLAALLEATRRREDRRSVLERVCAACVEVMGEPAVLAAVCTRQGENMLLESAAGRDGAGRQLDTFAYSAASFEKLVLEEDRVTALTDAASRPDLSLLHESGASFSSALCAPFRLGGKGGGALCVYGWRAHEWTTEQHDLLAWLADQCARVIESMRLQESLRESERAQREREETLQSFYQSASFLMGVAELDGDDAVAVSGNRAMEEFFTAAPGEPGSGVVALDGAPGLEARLAERFRESQAVGRPVRFEHVVARGGVTRTLSVTVAPIGAATHGRPLFSFVAEDVTERRRAEAALRERELASAAQEERSRLARDLHDSVTQALFAASLKAEALTGAGDLVSPQVVATVEEVRRLSRGALAQMRTMLLELRGDPLEEVPIDQLLRNVVEATESRTSTAVELHDQRRRGVGGAAARGPLPHHAGGAEQRRPPCPCRPRLGPSRAGARARAPLSGRRRRGVHRRPGRAHAPRPALDARARRGSRRALSPGEQRRRRDAGDGRVARRGRGGWE